VSDRRAKGRSGGRGRAGTVAGKQSKRSVTGRLTDHFVGRDARRAVLVFVLGRAFKLARKRYGRQPETLLSAKLGRGHQVGALALAPTGRKLRGRQRKAVIAGLADTYRAELDAVAGD